MPGHVLAMGGGALLSRDSRIEDFMLGLARSGRPRVCWAADGMLAIWRVHGIDAALREACERGAVVGGMSAGANCWFEDSVTDSFGPRLRKLGGGLGLLSGSFCPHYDGEPERRPTYARLVRDGALPEGYAADDDVAFHFRGTELREVVSQRAGARGYCVTPAGEEPLEPRLL